METVPLKIFATAARIQLLREVTARFNIVLALSSTARVEALDAVRALERAIEAEGGGPLGQKAVADQVAYMWFNRVIALRFMDANGYTGIGIVSPEAGNTNSQPEILTQAKLGQIDSKVLDINLVARVSGLLNGTIRSDDSQNEAYAILLLGYCRFWNKTMPFMFEKEGDFTELLIPSNLLSDDSVIAIALKTLTPEICSEVEVIGWLYQFYISDRKDEVFEGFKNNKKAGAAEIPAATQIFTPDWIVRYITQNSLGRLWFRNHPASKIPEQLAFYIPQLDFSEDDLLIHDLAELRIVDPACGSGHILTYAFDLLYFIYEEEGYSPDEIPALILTNNLFGVEIDPRAGSLAAFALVMKARAKQRSFFSKGVLPNICVLESINFSGEELLELISVSGNMLDEEVFLNQFETADLFGSLIIPNELVTSDVRNYLNTLDLQTLQGHNIQTRIRRVIEQAEYLSKRYHVVIANPPYMGSSNMDPKLVRWLKTNFPLYKSDLFAAFASRCSQMAIEGGQIGLMTPNVWMYISSHSALRKHLIFESRFQNLVELPLSGFIGATVQICAFNFSTLPPSLSETHFIRLVDKRGGDEGMAAFVKEAIAGNDLKIVHHARAGVFSNLPGNSLAYWLPESAFRVYKGGHQLSDVVEGQPGLQTSNNAQFVRFWHEVSFDRIGFNFGESHEAANSPYRWFPYLKGGDYRKWFGNETLVVDWENNGERIKSYVTEKYPYLNGNIDYVVKDRGRYFKKLISYTTISSGSFAARASDKGYIFDVAGSAVIPTSEDYELVLGFLCSVVGELFIKAQNPTLNVQSGDIASLPFNRDLLDLNRGEITLCVNKLIALSRQDWNSLESSWNFLVPKLFPSDGHGSHRIAHVYALALLNSEKLVSAAKDLEVRVNELFISSYGLEGDVSPDVSIEKVSIRSANVKEAVVEFISYCVGCMFGRYSPDHAGLILATQNHGLSEFFEKVPNPSLRPSEDNVIPIVDGEWFEEDIVDRFRKYLLLIFGIKYFEENLRFIEETLEKDIRKYFLSDFYKDHVQRYKKRPIYWLFSSKQGSFGALIYLHRYNSSTVGVVLNEYLREFDGKMRAELINQERISITSTSIKAKSTAEKETDRIRKVLIEINEYEREVLYPLATKQLTIDLDDGVKVNYSKFGSALKNVPGFGAHDE